MPRSSRTGVQGLYRDSDGRYRIDLRWRDPKTGAAKRHRERLAKDVQAVAAKARAKQILNAAKEGTFDPKRQPPKRLREAFDDYIDHVRAERAGREKDRRAHADAMAAFFGDIALEDLSPFRVEQFKKHRRS